MNLIVNSPITCRTSYGLSAINTILALEKTGVNVETIPIGGRADWYLEQPLQESLNRGTLFSRDIPCIRLYHEFDLAPHYGRGLHVGFPIFEKTKFTPQEIHQLKSVDLLFVCSEWAKRIVKDNGINTDVKIVHLGVDPEIFKPTGLKDGPFTFFFPGKFEIRKSFDIVLEVFEKAFTIKDDFQLVFLPTNHFIGQDNEEWSRYLMLSPLASKIKIIPELDHHSKVAEIYRQSDCVVSFSRAEGWGLPMLEALACGRNVIATNYSGHTEFLSNENSTLIDVDGLEGAIDGVFFHNPENQWAKITQSVKDELTKALRYHYKKGKGINNNGIKTAQQFTWANTANQIKKHLGFLC